MPACDLGGYCPRVQPMSILLSKTKIATSKITIATTADRRPMSKDPALASEAGVTSPGENLRGTTAKCWKAFCGFVAAAH